MTERSGTRERRDAVEIRKLDPRELGASTTEMAPLEADQLAAVARDLDLAEAPYGIFLVGESGLIRDVNRKAEELLGYRRDELIGMHVARVVSSYPDPEGNFAGTEIAGACSGICRACRRDGREIPVEVMRYVRITDVVAIVRPLLARDEPSPSARQRCNHEQQVAQLVHDLRGPLSTITLEIDRYLQREPVTSDARRSFDRIADNVAYLDRLVSDLLDAYSLDAGHFELHQERTELRALIVEVIARVLPTNDDGRLSVSASAPVVLPLDGLRVQRVVENFIHNAVKYSPRGSAIRISLDVLADRARVSVADHGPGISADDIPHIFDEHRRTRATRRLDGYGLGLYVSKRIVEAHGGRIGVASNLGDGATFYFELPR